MPEEEHWRAEDYEWDPYSLRASRQGAPAPAASPSHEAAEVTPEPEAAAAGGLRPASEARNETPAPSSSGGGAAGGASGGQGSGSGGEAPATVPVPVVRSTLNAAHGASKKKIPMRCQVDGCGRELAKEKEYYQRYRICAEHLRLSSLIKDGLAQRFCQQCGRFHVLADFDGDKRSCRARLNLHNDRRRKRLPEPAQTPRQDLGQPQPRGSRTRTRRRRAPCKGDAGEAELAAALARSPSPAKGRREPRGGRRQSAGAAEAGARPPGGGGALELREVDLAGSFQRAYQEVSAAAAGLQHQLSPASQALPLEQGRGFLGSPGGALSHFSHAAGDLPAELAPAERLLPHELPWLRPVAPSAEAPEQGSAHSSGGGNALFFGRAEPPPLLFRDGSGEPPAGGAGMPAWAAADSLARARQRAEAADDSPLGAFRPGSEGWYEQQAQLLRSSTWGFREEVQRQQLRQAAADLDFGAYACAGPGLRRPGSGEPQPPGDGAMPSRFSGNGPLASGASDSSSSHFTPLLAPQDSSGSRHPPPGPGRGLGLRQRMGPNSPPLPPAELRSEGLQRLQPRHSDPGGWHRSTPGGALAWEHLPPEGGGYGGWPRFHSYPADAGRFPSGSPQGPARPRLSRTGLKLSVAPDSLPEGLRQDYLRLLGSPAGGGGPYLDAAMRPGCTHIVATSLTQELIGDAMRAGERLVRPGSAWQAMDLLLQAPGCLLKVLAGRPVASWTGAELAALQPAAPLPGACAVVAGGALAVQLGARAPGPLRLLARCRGGFLADCQASGRELELELPPDAPDGLLWLEAEAGGLLSEAVPLVLSRDADIAAELAGLAAAGAPRRAAAGLLVDAGLVLEAADWLLGPVAGGAGAAAGGPPPPGCCRVLPPERRGAEASPLCDAAHLAFVCAAARRLAGLCCQQGWPALLARVLPVAAVGLSSWQQLAAAMEAHTGPRLLLHAAVASGSLSAVILLLDVCQLLGGGLDLVAAGSGGASALHLAAASPEMAALLLQRCPAAARLWNCARDAQGRAPADVAYMAGRQAGAEGCSCGPAGPTPATPRVGDLLPTARPGAAAAAGGGMFSSWPPRSAGAAAAAGGGSKEPGGHSRFRPPEQKPAQSPQPTEGAFTCSPC